MNSKTILNKTLPLIIALALIIIVAISCTVFATDKKEPVISYPDQAFLTVGDITIPNLKVYRDLKQQQGMTTLIDMFDKHLMQTTLNDANFSYYGAVSLNDINDEIEKAMFPNGRSDDDDENDETIAKWQRSMLLSFGLRNETDYQNYYRLTLAKKQYTKDMITKAYLDSIADNDPDKPETLLNDTITETNIKSYYDNNYTKAYWGIIVRYNTLQEAKNALGQLGIIIKQNNSGQDAWFWADTNVELTEEEVKQAFIDMYNTVNIYKAPGYPNLDPADDVVLGDDQYTISGGKITFNTVLDDDEDSPKNLLYYSTAALNRMFVNMESYVAGLDAYNATNSVFLRTFSVNPKTWSGANSYYYVFKVQFVDPQPLDDSAEGTALREDIIDKIIDSRVTAANIRSRMLTLRQEQGLVIYDSQLEKVYQNSHDATHVSTKKNHDTVVAKLGEHEITADELFAELSKRYGEISSIDYYQFEALLRGPHNTIYKYEGLGKPGEVLDTEEWNKVLQQVDDTKRYFEMGYFAEYGYTNTYGWLNFLRDFFISNYGISVTTVEELKIFYLYQRVVENYSKSISKTSTELWNEIYLPGMQKTFNEFLSATGMHILIHVEDANGQIVDPADWTAYQIACAEELYDMIIAELKAVRPGRYQSLMQSTIITEFENAPFFVSGLTQDIASQPKWTPGNDWLEIDEADYKYSQFKSAGLKIKFENLTTVANQMVKPFEDAVRAIWNEAEANNTFGDHVVIYDDKYEDYLVTEFGYHVYVNLTSSNRTTVTISGVVEVVQLPTLEQVLKYEEDDADEDLTTLIKRGITTYYAPIRAELTGASYYQLNINLDLIAKADQFVYTHSTLNANQEVKTIIESYIESYYNSLKYVSAPDA